MSLKTKFVVFNISIIVVPIIIYTAVSFNTIQSKNTEETIKRHKTQLESEYENVYNNVYVMGNIAQLVINNKDMMSFIGSYEEYTVDELIAFNQSTYKEVTSLQNNNPRIQEVSIYTDNTKVNEIWPLIYRESRILTSDWVKKATQYEGKAYWDINHLDEDIKVESAKISYGKNLVVSLVRELRYPSNRHIGFIRITMSSKDFFSKMFENIEDGSQMYILNLKGEINTNPKGFFSQKRNLNEKQLSDFLILNAKGKEGSLQYKNGNNQYTIIYREAPIENSYLLDVISLNEINKGIKDGKKRVLIGAVLVILILSASIYLITSKLLNRLLIITKSLKKVESGEFDIDISITSGDEIGLLAFHFRQMVKKINYLIEDSISKQMVTKEAELKALKNQIDAHFLYNTLENIKMMAEIGGNFEVSDSLTNLGALMRYNMKWEKESVSLSDEIVHIKNYISLMDIRYEHNINFKVDIDKDILTKEILKLSLQPIIENSIKHGLAKKLRYEDGLITLSALIDHNFTYIIIEDNGVGMNEKQLNDIRNYLQSSNENDKKGLGIKTVCERIRIFYGDKYGIEVNSKENEFTRVILKLPR